MSRWHREHPDYEETGEQPPDYRAMADDLRKRVKEEGRPCITCGVTLVLPPATRCVRCQRSLEEDRLERESGR